MKEDIAQYAASRMEDLKEQLGNEETLREIQYQSYLAGWHAALAEAIRTLMKFQVQTPRTSFDRP